MLWAVHDVDVDLEKVQREGGGRVLDGEPQGSGWVPQASSMPSSSSLEDPVTSSSHIIGHTWPFAACTQPWIHPRQLPSVGPGQGRNTPAALAPTSGPLHNSEPQGQYP